MKAKRLNLLPADLIPNRRLKPEQWLAIAMTAFVSYVLISVPYLSSVAKKTKVEVKRLEDQNSNLLTEFARISKIDVPKNTDELNFQAYRELIAHRSDWARTFQELSAITLKGIWLEELKTQQKEKGTILTIDGLALSLADMSAFFDALEKSFYFRKVSLKTTDLVEEVEPSQFKFQFNVELPKKERGVLNEHF